jgi:ABC-type nitrate/sulfonate/bicarbonate transport system substrate-binding protein
MRSFSLALALVLGLALVRPAPAQQMEEATFALPAITFAFVPAYIAEDLGFWTKRGLKVKQTVITGIGAMNAVLSKSVEFSISSMPTVIRANVRGQKVLAIGGAFEGTAVELVLRKEVAQAAGITEASPLASRAASLKGKTVAMLAPNTIVHGYLRYFAKKGGIDPERDFKIAIMSQEASIAAIKSGAVDAMAQVLPYSTISIHNGTAIMLSSGPRGEFPELNPFALNGITSPMGFCETKESMCRKMVEGYHEGMIYLLDHPKEAGEILKKRVTGMDEGAFQDAFAMTRKWTPRTMKISDQGIRNAQELMVIGGMLKEEEKLKSFAEIYTNKYAP